MLHYRPYGFCGNESKPIEGCGNNRSNQLQSTARGDGGTEQEGGSYEKLVNMAVYETGSGELRQLNFGLEGHF